MSQLHCHWLKQHCLSLKQEKSALEESVINMLSKLLFIVLLIHINFIANSIHFVFKEMGFKMPQIYEDLNVLSWKVQYIKRKFKLLSRNFLNLTNNLGLVALHPNVGTSVFCMFLKRTII